MKVAYHYLFFKLYKQNKNKNSGSFVPLTVATQILTIEVLLILCILGDVSVILETDLIALPIIQNLFLGVIGLLAVVKYFMFIRKENWRTYFPLFESWNKAKRKSADIWIRGLIYFLVTNFTLLLYFINGEVWL